MPHLAYKFRLNPTPAQSRELASQLETLRQVYNAALAYRRDLYAQESRSPGATEMYRVFSGIRNAQIADRKAGGEGPHWLAQVSMHAVRDTLKRVERAFDCFFRRLKAKAEKPGYPRFKGRGRLRSIPFDNYNNGCVIRDPDGRALRADVPAAKKGYRLDVFRVGRVRIVAHRDIVGRIKTASVLREPDGKWYVVLMAEQAAGEAAPKDGPAVGVDVGLEHFFTDSDGGHEPNPRFLKCELPRLRRLQRSASRKAEAAKKRGQKQRECKNLAKAWAKVAKLHVRVRNLRKEHRHQVVNRLVDRCGIICVESLRVENLARNSKVGRAIMDAGWAGFVIALKHKAARAGVRVVEVNPAGTSQTCPDCGGEVRKTLRERTHACPHCGLVCHRDHAAARVILARGLSGVGAAPVEGNVAQQGERSPRSVSRTGPVPPRSAAKGNGRLEKTARPRPDTEDAVHQQLRTLQEQIQTHYDATREAVAEFTATADELPPEQAKTVLAHLEAADLALVEAGLAAGAEVPEVAR